MTRKNVTYTVVKLFKFLLNLLLKHYNAIN